MDIIPNSDNPLLKVKNEFLKYDSNRNHFEGLGGRKTVSREKQQSGLLKMFWISFAGFRPHVDNDGFYKNGDSFSVGWLLKNLIQKSSKYRKVVSPYYDPGSQWDQKRKKTRMWTLYKETDEVLDKVFRSNEPLELDIPRTFHNCSPQYRPKTSSIRIPTFLPIRLDELDREVSRLDEVLKNKKSIKSLIENGYPEDNKRTRNRLLILRKICVSVKPSNNVPNFYERGDYGRLFGVSFNLQWVSKSVRFRLLSGNNLYDYDFVSCHPAIFHCLMTHYKLPCPILDQYIQRRDTFVEELTKLLILRKEEVKELLTLIINSADFQSPYKRVYSLLREKKGKFSRIDLLKNCEWFMDLTEEYKNGRQELLKEFQKKRYLTSPTGNILSLKKGQNSGSKISFILQSIESQLLEYGCSPYNDTWLLCFDGWVSPKRDIVKVESTINKRIKKQTGMEIQIKIRETKI